jgi:hypothetical protein
MQSKQMLISNPVNRWTVVSVSVAALLVLAPVTRLFAGTTAHRPVPRPKLVSADPMTLHPADADKDMGPGEAESVLAQHPGATR